MQPDNERRLISHGITPGMGREERLRSIESRLLKAGDVPNFTVDQQVALLHELSTFELGQFLLDHRGINGYWTHRLVTYLPGTLARKQSCDLEYQLFERIPAVLATRERFQIFCEELQSRLATGLCLASVPCGLMGELLLLDYSAHRDIRMVGIDLDEHALKGALALASQQQVSGRVSLRREDAWAGSLRAEIDVLASNGLNIYEPDDAHVVALYRSFFEALKPGGTLITSFLTPPPGQALPSSWDMSQIDEPSLSLQAMLFTRIIEVKWSSFRTHAQTKDQLEAAGFTDVHFRDDRARIFPTVIAKRPGGQ